MINISKITLSYDGSDTQCCARCGQRIRNIATLEDGTTYGTECIKYIVGLNVDQIKAKHYQEAHAKDYDKVNAQREEFNKNIEELKAKYEPVNTYLINFLMECDEKEIYNNQKGEYVTIQSEGIAFKLAEELRIKSLDDLTDKQFNLIWDMLDNQNVKYLKEMAKNKGIKKVTGMKKEDFIEFILN